MITSGPRFTAATQLTLCLTVGLLTALAGCQQRTASKLLGTWIGHPDTASARAIREAKRYGEDPAATTSPAGSPQVKTDWEAYDISIKLSFLPGGELEMSLSDGTEPVSGTWEIVETSGVGCTIEVNTQRENQEPELRHFQIEFDERDGQCMGFLLWELGADRQLGVLYFAPEA